MEFQYRAGDERRSRSLPPSTPSPPAAPSTSGSGAADSHGGGGGGGGPAQSVGNPAMEPRQPATPPATTAADSADELRRQAVKARIRERVLREEAEQWELELEVRHEIREQLLRLSWPVLGRSAAGSGTPGGAPPPARIVTGTASLPIASREAAHPDANKAATSWAKRKSPDHGAASTVSAATSSKRQKITLTCTVCDISTNSEKAMHDHVNGKVHKRKAMALLELPKPMTHPEPKTGQEARVEEFAPSGDYTPTKLTMLTNTGAMNEVMQMDGYLLCEVCNVGTADRVTMMFHLQGSKHISKGQASSKPPDQAAKVGVKNLSVPEADISAVASADPEKLVLELYGVSHTVRRLGGFLLCELCNVKALSMNGIRQHLLGKKHKNKANASSDVSIKVSTVGNAEKVQLMDTDTAVVAGMSVQVEAPLVKSVEAKVDSDCELQGTSMTSTKEDAATGDSTKTHGKKGMNASSSAATAEDNNLCRSDSLTMEVDNVCHPIQRVDGFLVCPCCNTKAPSEIIMRSHLAGKKHKHKMTLAVRKKKKGPSVVATGADEVLGNSSKSVKAGEKAEPVLPLAVLQAKNAAAMAPMKVDDLAEVEPATLIEPAEGGEITRVQNNSSKSMKADEEAESEPSMAEPQVKNIPAIAPMEVDGPAEVQTYVEPIQDGEITAEPGGEHVVGIANGSAAQAKESVETNDNAAPGKTIKIQVEGKVFTVLQQQNGRLSCQTCGVHGCNKDGMILHLYTRMHWDKANLAQKEKDDDAAAAAASAVDKDASNGGSAAGECSGGAETATV